MNRVAAKTLTEAIDRSMQDGPTVGMTKNAQTLHRELIKQHVTEFVTQQFGDAMFHSDDVNQEVAFRALLNNILGGSI